MRRFRRITSDTRIRQKPKTIGLFVSSILALSSPAWPQSDVTFQSVENALLALENSLSAQQIAPPAVPIPPQPDQVPPTEPQPPIAPPPVNLTQAPPGFSNGGGHEDTATNGDDFDFLPILENQECPRRISDVAESAKAYSVSVSKIESSITELGTRFEKLEKLDREYAFDQSITECPKRFVADVEQMITDLSALEIASVVQGAETLSVCTQQGRQAVDNRMSELAQSSDLNAARERLSLGGVLNRWANADVDLSAAVGSLVFYDRRRARLTTAAEGIRQRCQLLKGIYE